MKLLYIVPAINNEGGVARVLAMKTNYLVVKFGYQIHILTQNQGGFPRFYDFDERIIFHDMILSGNVFQFFNSYSIALKRNIESIQPDCIIVCDNGLKAYTIPFILGKKVPIILESHGSKYVEERQSSDDFFQKYVRSFKYKFKDFYAGKFTKLVVLSNESLKEWNVNNGLIISNPVWLQTDVSAKSASKKVLAIARNSYEKGLDRLLVIWQEITKLHPDWTLEIYGSNTADLKKTAEQMGIDATVLFFDPVKNIEERYREASIYVMTSRYEGFPMVLLEAMACGLPCIAYDCPCGPRAIIDEGENGFLIDDNAIALFVTKLNFLIKDESVRKAIGEKAKLSSEKYHIDAIMETWHQLFIAIKKN